MKYPNLLDRGKIKLDNFVWCSKWKHKPATSKMHDQIMNLGELGVIRYKRNSTNSTKWFLHILIHQPKCSWKNREKNRRNCRWSICFFLSSSSIYRICVYLVPYRAVIYWGTDVSGWRSASIWHLNKHSSVFSSSFSFSSNDLPLVSRVNKYVTAIPKRQITPKLTRAILIGPILGRSSGSLLFEAHKNPRVPKKAPTFPTAPEIPWQVDLNLAGKSSAGTIKVVVLGPKFAKKKVRP